MVTRSALGLVAVYNLLPQNLKAVTQVKEFQQGLQMILKQRLEEGCTDLQATFCPRGPLAKHALKNI